MESHIKHADYTAENNGNEQASINIVDGSEQEIRKRDNFLDTVSTIFNTSRWFGVSPYDFTFSFCWTVINFSLLLAVESAAIWKLIRAIMGIAFNTAGGHSLMARLSGSIFYANGLISLILSLKLIASWESVRSCWMRNELSPGFHLPPDVHIRRNVILVSTFVAVCAFVEHIMSMVSAIGLECEPSEYLRKYILVSHGFLLQDYEYNIWFAILILFISKIATILWNFQDLIIILLSLGLASRYNRLNLYVKIMAKSEKEDEYLEEDANELYIRMQKWRKTREAYVRQASLVREVDDKLGALVLLSSLNNFYFICLQLFLGINKEKGSLINRIYYFVSLLWLIFRACAVVLAASDINVRSKGALPLLYGCPGSTYNAEISRLKTQLNYDNVVLRGMGLFSLDRSLLLKVAAAILKYELVLIQYDK